MASAMALRRACLRTIINSTRCSIATSFISKPNQQSLTRYFRNNGSVFNIREYSRQAVEESENAKNEKDIKVDAEEKEQLVSIEEHEKLVERVKEIEDKYKRALADSENIRTRMRREIKDAKQFGIQSFVKDLVEVSDVLEKATESVPKEALAEGNVHLKSLYEGLQMTEAQLLTVFKRHGVFQINPVGEKFDPNHHEALFEQEDSTKEPGSVGTVTKVGYRLHERLVRPAMVGVVKATKS